MDTNNSSKQESNPVAVKLASRGIDFGKVRKVLVVAHCTREKRVNCEEVERVLSKHNLPLPSFDIKNEPKYREILKQFVKPAREIYGGTFTRVIEIVDTLRSYGKHVDVYIISGRYGLISENDEIIPYEAALNKMKPSEIREWSRHEAEKRMLVIVPEVCALFLVLINDTGYILKAS